MIDHLKTMMYSGGGIAAIGAGLFAAWGYIQMGIRYLVGIFIGTATLKDEAGAATMAFAFNRAIKSPLGMRVFGGYESYVHPKRWRESVAYEGLSSDPIIIKYGRQFVLVSLRNNSSNSNVGSFDRNEYLITIRYLRWFFDVEQFTIDALDYYNAEKRQRNGHSNKKKRSIRFKIIRCSGSAGGKTAISEDDLASSAMGEYPAPSTKSSESIEQMIMTGAFRLLKWNRDDLQMKPEEGQSAFTGYPFPDQVADAIQELNCWLANEKWFRSKSIPWRRGWLLYGPPGTGKCLGKGTPVMMFDGTIVSVEEIKPGDLLMGPDSRPRKVLSTTCGIDDLYKITPVKGEPYIVNKNHILSLKMSGNNCGYKHGDIVNISIEDYKTKSKWFRERAKGWRTGIEFQMKELPLDPYFLGLWLGDGSSNSPRITTASPAYAFAYIP